MGGNLSVSVMTRPLFLTSALGTRSSLVPGKCLFLKQLIGATATVPHFSSCLESLGAVVTYWSSEIDHSESVYTREIGKRCKSELFYFESW